MSDNDKPSDPTDTSWMDKMPEVKLPSWRLMADTFPAVATPVGASMETFSLNVGSASLPAATEEEGAAGSQASPIITQVEDSGL